MKEVKKSIGKEKIPEINLLNSFLLNTGTNQLIPTFQGDIDGIDMSKGYYNLFYGPSCSHCQMFMPKLNNAIEEIEKAGYRLPITKINVEDKNTGADILINYFKINGVPTILYNYGRDYIVYDPYEKDKDGNQVPLSEGLLKFMQAIQDDTTEKKYLETVIEKIKENKEKETSKKN